MSRAYRSFDRKLKKSQSSSGNAISATGAIYAIRRALFRGVPVGVTDDFAVSTDVIVQGYRSVFAPDAIAYLFLVRYRRDRASARVITRPAGVLVSGASC
ncbi:MAG: hypothetical protein U0Z44_06555 [Kouleothrix sp.]